MAEPTPPGAPRPAATVLVLRTSTRPEHPGEAELYMVQRTTRATFMAGAYVFPGGRVDALDQDLEVLSRCVGLEAPQAARRLWDLVPPEQAMGLHVAALRELFEEAGLLLARTADGRPFSVSDEDTAARLRFFREAVHEGRASLAQVLQAEDLYLDLGTLHPWAHWLTPEIEAKRFDTWFFVVAEPAGQTALHDDKELTAGEWVHPQTALTRHAAGSFPLAPPTWRTLEELAELRMPEVIFAASPGRRLHAIMPIFRQADEGLVLLLPGDPEYPVPEGHQVLGPTRIAMAQGRWWSRQG